MNNITSPPTPTYRRTFYVWWFGLFTIVSMAMNGAHAFLNSPVAWTDVPVPIREWLSVGGSMPTWFATMAVSVSVVPPVALAFATHALVTPDPTTTSGRGVGARTTTWIIATGAFVFSTVAMTDLTHMLFAVPIPLALIMPVIIDVSIVAAVLRLEIRRRGHAAEAHIPEAAKQPDLGEAASEPSHDAHDERVMAQPEAAHEPVLKQPSVPHEPPREAAVSRPIVTRESVVNRPVSQSSPLSLTHDATTVAQRISASTTISQPVEVITKVLELAMTPGMSQRKVADAMPKNDKVSSSTVGRIITAARELDQSNDQEDAEQQQLDGERELALA